MPYIYIASFNIEKNGQSSDPEKQAKVSDFVAHCCNRQVDMIFLCEVHSVRIGNYVDFLTSTYGEDYACDYLEGGHSNAYVILVRKENGFKLSYDRLRGLNRNLLLCHRDGEIAIGFAHFKSGQTGLTQDQLEAGASFLDTLVGESGRWVITGDMNWDLHRYDELTLPNGSQYATSWNDKTHKAGGILDWCLGGNGMTLLALDGREEFLPEYRTMDGPDHRPVMFEIRY